MATTTGSVVNFRGFGKLKQATLTEEEAARCVRPSSQKDYVQARLDGAIRFSHGGREFKNCYTSADGTERRQIEVTATCIRCTLCPDSRTWSLGTDRKSLMRDLVRHCSGTGNKLYAATQQHLDRLALSAGAPPITEASTTPAPAPVVSPAPAPAEPPHVPLASLQIPPPTAAERAPALPPAPLPLPPPRAPVPRRASPTGGGRIVIGAGVEADPLAFGHEHTNGVGVRAQYRGIVVKPGTHNELPEGCPPPETGDRV